MIAAQVANTATKFEQPMYEAYSVAVYTTWVAGIASGSKATGKTLINKSAALFLTCQGTCHYNLWILLIFSAITKFCYTRTCFSV